MSPPWSTPADEGAALFVAGRYVYMEDLKRLAGLLPLPLETPPPPDVRHIVTPLKANAWDRLLQELPDREYAEFVVRDL